MSLGNFSGDIYNALQALTSKFDLGAGVALSIGAIKGQTPVVKFGNCPDAALNVKTDCWASGGVQPSYIFPADAGESVAISSTNPTDTQEITIFGLDENGIEVEVNANLNGLTPVVISGLFRAVNTAFNNDSTSCLGTVSIKGAASGNEFASFTPVSQQTTQCIYMIPYGKYGSVLSLAAAINDGGNQDNTCEVVFAAQEYGKVWRTQIVYGLQQRGTSNLPTDLILPKTYPPLTRLKVSFTPDSLQSVSAQLAIKLIDSEIVDAISS